MKKTELIKTSPNTINLVNIKEHEVTSSINNSWKNQYDNLKQKINGLEKNNSEIIQIYTSEEDRLKKSTSNYISIEQNRQKNIDELEILALNLRKECENFKNLINEKELLFQFLSNNLNENGDQVEANIDFEHMTNVEKIKQEEKLKRYLNKIKGEFEKKVLLKKKELEEYYLMKDMEKYPWKYMKEPPPPKVNKNISLEKKSEKLPMEINNYEIHSIHYNMGLSETDIYLISELIAVQCLKEEFPKEFFIDYVFDEIEKQIKNNKENNVSYNNKENEEIINNQNNLKNFHNSLAIESVFVADKISQILDIKSEEDINMIIKYLDLISKKDKDLLKASLDLQLTGFRYRQYESEEIDNYNNMLKNIFQNKKEQINDLKNIYEKKNNIIHIAEFNYFLKMNNISMMSDLYYYLLTIMKISKKERIFHQSKFQTLQKLHLYELLLTPLMNLLEKNIN